MFTVQADTLEQYFDADPARKGDLQAFDALMRDTVPRLERWFYAGAADGKPGMRMKLIGYGAFRYEVASGEQVTWPIVGLALQKNYLSVYTSVVAGGAPIMDRYKGALGELRMGRNNFSFATFGQLDQKSVAALLTAIDEAVHADPLGSVEYSAYRIAWSSAQSQ